MVQKKITSNIVDSTEEGGDDPTRSVSEDDVVFFLDNNPKFFSDRQELLSKMVVPSPWAGDGVVDMQRFIADQRLREINELRDCAQEVIETSRSNMSVQTQTHAAVLALLRANDMGQLLQVISDDLPILLDVDVVVLGFEPPGLKAGVSMSLETETLNLGVGDVDFILEQDKEIILLHNVDETLAGKVGVFGAASGLVRSAGLVRLHPSHGVPLGILGLGSRLQIFGPGQGTEMIGFLARAMETCLHKAVRNNVYI